ncbi:MAG: hypothetical protein ABI647_16065, partial [Gemmatimonadota bacterium]
APSQTPNIYQAPTITGNSIKLWFSVQCGTNLSSVTGATTPGEVGISSSYGFNAVYQNGTACTHLLYPVNGMPIGIHTFTVTSHWRQSLDPNLPAVIPTAGTSASVSVEIKP